MSKFEINEERFIGIIQIVLSLYILIFAVQNPSFIMALFMGCIGCLLLFCGAFMLSLEEK